jgi:hypothetical protein
MIVCVFVSSKPLPACPNPEHSNNGMHVTLERSTDMGVRGPACVQQQQFSYGWLVLLGRKTSTDKLSCTLILYRQTSFLAIIHPTKICS